MAIQNRRGNFADFDPYKMLPGEFAYVLDRNELYYCVAPGSAKRVATQDELIDILNTTSEAYTALQQLISELESETVLTGILTDISSLLDRTAQNESDIGSLGSLPTVDKSNLVGAITEIDSDLSTHLAENAIDAHGIIPSCKVYHNQDQSIISSILTALAFNSERWDTDSMHDVATNNNRLVCKKPGKYLVVGQAMFATNATGVRSLSVRQNGSTTMSTISSMALTGQETSLVTSIILDLVLNDYVELLVYQNSGGALSVLDNQQRSPYFMMTKLG